MKNFLWKQVVIGGFCIQASASYAVDAKKIALMAGVPMASTILGNSACEYPTSCKVDATPEDSGRRLLRKRNLETGSCGAKFADNDLSVSWVHATTQASCFGSCGKFTIDSEGPFWSTFFDPKSLDGDGKFFINGYDGEGGELTLKRDVDNLGSGKLSFQYQYAYDMIPYGASIDRELKVEVIERSTGNTLFLESGLAPALAGHSLGDSGVLSATLNLDIGSPKDVTIIFHWIVPQTYTGPAQFVLDDISFDPDTDGDGVCDNNDKCLDTEEGAIVRQDGCSLEQVCPCDGDWKNHGQFVACVAHFTNELLVNEEEKGQIQSDAAQSNCGK